MDFEQKTWFNKDANGNVPNGAPAFSAENMNRIEKCLSDLILYVEAIQKNTENMIKACDYNTIIQPKTEITANSTATLTDTWTATEDCWLSVKAHGSSAGNTVFIYIDDTLILEGDYNRPDDYYPPNIYVKKGSIITLETRGSGSTAGFIAYACLS